MVKRIAFVLVSFLSGLHASETLNIAVTSSFKPVLEVLAESFLKQSGIKLNLSSASTGVLAQQIMAGAPFDVFFAADRERPEIVAKNLSLPDQVLSPYAIGQLVFVSPNALTTLDQLSTYDGKVIVANPSLAPYGEAAQEILDKLGFTGQRVLANNVVQARQYLKLGLSPFGLTAKSVVLDLPHTDVPSSYYSPLVQNLIVLKTTDESEALLSFLKSELARRIIVEHGYRLPN